MHTPLIIFIAVIVAGVLTLLYMIKRVNKGENKRISDMK